MKRRTLLLVILLLAIISIVSFAWAQTSATVTLDITAGEFATVQTAPGVERPGWTPRGRTVGSTGGGHLYYINHGEYEGDLLVLLHLTNAGDLAGGYSFLTMQIGVYAYDDEDGAIGANLVDSHLTMVNGYVVFVLRAADTGDAGFVVMVERGSWYCHTAAGPLSPQFHIEVRQA